MLYPISFFKAPSDRWVWLPNSLGGYSVRGAYQLLTITDTPLADSAAAMIWHNQVPLKVSVFAWRLLRERLPTKSNLVTRGVISSEASQCISDCGSIETTQHLFLACCGFSSLWPMVRHWLGFMGVDTNVLSDHFLQFVYSTGGGKSKGVVLSVQLAPVCMSLMEWA
jgi:hypothetical protein